MTSRRLLRTGDGAVDATGDANSAPVRLIPFDARSAARHPAAPYRIIDVPTAPPGRPRGRSVPSRWTLLAATAGGALVAASALAAVRLAPRDSPAPPATETAAVTRIPSPPASSPAAVAYLPSPSLSPRPAASPSPAPPSTPARTPTSAPTPVPRPAATKPPSLPALTPTLLPTATPRPTATPTARPRPMPTPTRVSAY